MTRARYSKPAITSTPVLILWASATNEERRPIALLELECRRCRLYFCRLIYRGDRFIVASLTSLSGPQLCLDCAT